MKDFIPYEKLSKRAKRESSSARRVLWSRSPVTRRPKNPAAYDRAKARRRDRGEME